jgi:hypothetical protein
MKKGQSGHADLRRQTPRHHQPVPAFDVLDGTVIGQCSATGTHKHPKVLCWLSRHPRFVIHFTPTSCSWLNAVETFFSRLTRRRLKRGVFRSIVDLQAAIDRFIEDHNAEPKPLVWTADPDIILDEVTCGTQALASMH